MFTSISYFYSSLQKISNIKHKINLAHIEWGMSIVIIILNDACHSLHCHFMNPHPVLSIHSVAEAFAKNIEGFKPPVKYFLAVLCPCKKLLKLRRVLIFWQYNFAWLTNVSAVSNTFLSFFKFKVEGCLVPIIFVRIGVTTTEDCDVVYGRLCGPLIQQIRGS